MVVLRIAGKTQSYDWGKLGDSSKVASLSASTPGFTGDISKPYAELWMGTHPNGPGILLDGTNRTLKEILNESNLGSSISKEYDGDLPFLFKVLSIRKALSIQAHPDKFLARDLFTRFPKIYKDPNHKPEMAVALTPFGAFIGFRPLFEIAVHLLTFPEFSAVVGEDVSTKFLNQSQFSAPVESASKLALKNLFKALMTASDDVIKKQVDEMVTRIKASKIAEGSIEELVIRLNEQFPGDVGIFCAFLLNFVKLEPGEAIFLAANEPHAYLSGDCVECMAASDNVVRSGLTPKLKDVDTLISMLTYNHGPADAQILRGDPYKQSGLVLPHTKLYDPPIQEFSILRTHLHPPLAEHFDGIDGPSILIVTEGSGNIECEDGLLEAKEGYVFFVGAGSPLTIHAVGSKPAVFYRAYCV
ncbi:Mannose-6-phosphate isomerase [Nowakowskiella sp. JEL0078]|nr:Mannose-6-phosphate isomerase [Nowakowskiella sp. JEL0078]